MRTLKPRAGGSAAAALCAAAAPSPPSTLPSPLNVVRLFWILAAAWLAACFASSFFFFSQSMLLARSRRRLPGAAWSVWFDLYAAPNAALFLDRSTFVEVAMWSALLPAAKNNSHSVPSFRNPSENFVLELFISTREAGQRESDNTRMARVAYLTLFFANAIVAAFMREFGKSA